MPITGDDIPVGSGVKWYAGGEITTEQHTVTSGDATATGFALSGTAEYGSVVATVNGVEVAIIEYDTSAATPATEDDGTDFIGYSGIAENDVVEIWYVDVGTTALSLIAASQDVSFSASPDKSTETIHGQANKVTFIGATEHTATLDELYYSQTFVALVYGTQVTGSPASGDQKWSTAFTGAKKIGALVGKRFDSSGNVTEKWVLAGAQATGLDGSFPSAGAYKRSFSFNVDHVTEVVFA